MLPIKMSDSHGGGIDFSTDSVGHHVWRFWPRWLALWWVVLTLPSCSLIGCLTNPTYRS